MRGALSWRGTATVNDGTSHAFDVITAGGDLPSLIKASDYESPTAKVTSSLTASSGVRYHRQLWGRTVL